MSTIYDTTVNTIDGVSQSLSDYAGKVLLVVNVASKCGLTPQYEQLEALYQAKHASGLEILGFPCNQFLGQEPGSEAEVKSFCSLTYGVSFPMFSKVEVNGEGRHPLYQQLIAAQPQRTTEEGSGFRDKLAGMNLLSDDDSDVMWNFEKFLIGKDGTVIGRFAPDMTVNSPVLQAAIDAALAL
ncbi:MULTISPECIES: glutathione peroxidase [unclassified Oceanobacter]|jgi:glutathione peroxidase|uniref:glutathione peroxidase n=1 Tax=unclassified Oceanobacter TaxID=2620260 RepID=UPI0027339246|nr:MULTISPECIES: glutathione peroxidase [unclassified Oceanobacter]MDP2505794.1 glutathione peroxidase [Oceanobacter sp. 3_MG-2023]MDP2549358.1 glutathione peroxidase [Oceanobacter sp. 4_MG-2023]MDP2609091.1 glutathione peroxidase [Oceanobacter sp. 1_MG-2023]MDP2612413.1 glutathione peroxidase [Oceanobacter sp. 2_MG-2023]